MLVLDGIGCINISSGARISGASACALLRRTAVLLFTCRMVFELFVLVEVCDKFPNYTGLIRVQNCPAHGAVFRVIELVTPRESQ